MNPDLHWKFEYDANINYIYYINFEIERNHQKRKIDEIDYRAVGTAAGRARPRQSFRQGRAGEYNRKNQPHSAIKLNITLVVQKFITQGKYWQFLYYRG